nr:hypothetical protein [Tanacetum cinerariifolium]
MAWCLAISTPKALRSLAYLMLSSSEPEAIPRACAAMPIRPPASTCMANLKPKPSAPMRFSLGTFTSLKSSEHVSEPRMPSLFSLGPCWKPGMSLSTISTLMPRDFSSGLVWAITRYTEAVVPLVIQFLVPFS